MEKGMSKVIIEKPKSEKSIRDIPISTKFYKILKTLKSGYKETDYFLTGNSNKFIEPRNLDYYFKRLLEKEKLNEYKFHS